jgi:prephenate dehydrogenase
MRIFILGAGHMGAWLVEEFCLDHQVAVYDTDKKSSNTFLTFRG